jgi:hypothetical protein
MLSIVLMTITSCRTDNNQWERDIPTIPGDTPTIPADPGDTGDDPLKPNSQTTDMENAISISFEDNGTVTVNNPFANNGVTVEISGEHVTVRSTRTDVELNYILSGITDNGSVKIYGEYRFGLVLNGVGITNPSGAAINIQCGKKVTVTVIDNTQNRLIDGTNYVYTGGEDMKAALFSEGQLNFYGNGLLEVRGKNKHAICSDDYIHIYNGNINIKEAASDGVHANDVVLISGGSINVRSAGDGIESEKDAVEIAGGEIGVITTGEKGHAVKSAGNTTVSGGNITLTVYGNGSKCFKTSGDMTISSGIIAINTAGNAFYEDGDITSSAGIKCDGKLTVNGGDITIVSAGTGGKGISADGDIVINNGNITVTTTGGQYVYSRNYDTAAKAIKSDGNLTVNGGTIVIRTYGVEAEGLESKKTLTITGGDIDIAAYDDCINAAIHIQIDGGRIYCISAVNDAIDSNGTMTVTGGLVVVAGAANGEDGFDCDNNRFTITGGTLVGIGGATSNPTANYCTQRSVVFGSSTSNLSIVRIEATSGGTEALTFHLPRTYSKTTLLFSSSALEANTGYTIYTGGSIAGGTDFHGFYTGATYTRGTAAGTFTTTSMLSTVGSSSPGGNPGGGGGGGPR